MHTVQTSPPDQVSTGGLPPWGTQGRDLKASRILKVMKHFTSTPVEMTTWVDLGCGSGGIAAALAPHVKHITGIDPESWPYWQEYSKRQLNLSFVRQPVEQLAIPHESVDVVVCNQVYEHVPDPQFLIQQIYRVLKPGGYCYFAGPNLIFPIEPHVFWPFVHWLPRRFAVNVMRMLGARKVVDANSVSYWTLRKWLAAFEVRNALPDIIAAPGKFGFHGRLYRALSWIPRRFIENLTWLSPGFVFVLRKPDH